MGDMDNLIADLKKSFRASKEAAKENEKKTAKEAAQKALITYNTFSDSEKKLLVEFCHAAPEKFLEEMSSETSELFKIKNPPDVSTLTGLSKDIWDKYVSLKQTDEQFTNKLRLWKSLNEFIKSELPEYGLFAAGSTLNGFGLQTSDIDLSLVTTKSVPTEIDTSLEHLRKLITLVAKYDKFSYAIDSVETIHAKIPLLKFHEKEYNFHVDINFNITSNIQNTHLLYCYSQVDWRVSPLVTIVKQWAKTQDLLDAKYGSLSSYPLVLMVIHFLQAGVKPKILPSLQNCLKGKFESTVECIDYFNKIEVPFSELYPQNKQSLEELLLQFFEYYEKFKFNEYVISIREADKILKSEYNSKFKSTTDYVSGFMFIEEPFNLSNVGKTVYKSETFENIKSMIEKTSLLLKTTKNLSDIMDESLKEKI